MTTNDAFTKINSVLRQPEVTIHTVYGELMDDLTFPQDPPLNGVHPRIRTCRMVIEYQLDERSHQVVVGD